MNSGKFFNFGKWYRIGAMAGILVLAFSLVAIVFAFGAHEKSRLSTQIRAEKTLPAANQDMVRLAFFYGGSDLISATLAAGDFAALLSAETGLTVEVSLVNCEAILLEQLGSGFVDLAPLSPVAYVYGHDQHSLEARITNGRFGIFQSRGQFNVPAAKGYTSIWDLQGKSYLASAPGSFSGYFAPYIFISNTTGMTPDQFFSDVSFAGGQDQVIREIYSGTAEVGTTFEDARVNLEMELPDVYTVVHVLTYTAYIPNEPWAFRPGLDVTTAQTVVDGILAVGNTDAGKTALGTIFDYSFYSGVAPTQDSSYDIIRSFVNEFGLTTEACNPVYTPVILKNGSP